MRAVVMREFGPPGVLIAHQLPDPQPGPGQVLVEVEFANVTFVETMTRAGRAPNPAMAPELPAIPGNGVGGKVAELGGGVDEALLGARVISSTGGSGGYADVVVVPADGLIEVPDGLELADAVALLADGRTAVGLIRSAGIRPGETVLVEAAAGGVGSLLVQLAGSAGARVVAAAGGERKLEIAKSLGADSAVDYTRNGWPDEAGPVDVVFDGVGGVLGRTAFELLRPGGRMCSFGLASGSFTQVDPDEAERRQVSLIRRPPPRPEELLELTRAALDEALAGRLKPVIGQVLPLERAADAHAAIEARATVGKTLLRAR
jgi:NADPH2:quinone reductase